MKHLSEEQMVALYYGEASEESQRHLIDCTVCRCGVEQLSFVLAEAGKHPVPERGENYGADVWRRIQPRLAYKREKFFHFRWMWLGPAFAAIAVAAFLIGVFAQRQSSTGALSEQARTRVLLIAMSDHLERSQMVLADLVNASPAIGLMPEEQTSARELLAENRLLREMARGTANALQRSVLDRLERVLMDVANAPAKPSRRQIEDLQEQIKTEGLLMEVRVLGANVRREGQKS